MLGGFNSFRGIRSLSLSARTRNESDVLRGGELLYHFWQT